MFKASTGRLVTTAKPNSTTLSKPQQSSEFTAAIRGLATSQQQGNQSASQSNQDTIAQKPGKSESDAKPVKKMTVAEQDELLRKKMAGIEGDGGAAGVEYENGQPVAMKRSVKNNMFRYI